MNWTAISAVSCLVQSVLVVASLWVYDRTASAKHEGHDRESFQEILETDIDIISDYMQQGRRTRLA